MIASQIIDTGKSKSFPNGLTLSLANGDKTQSLIIIGDSVAKAYQALSLIHI